MKNKLLILAGLAIFAAPTIFFHEPEAHAYSSQTGADPDRSGIADGASSMFTNEIETKVVKKSTIAGVSDAISPGYFVGLEPTVLDGYTVTRIVAQSRLGQKTVMCLAAETMATGDTGYHSCITKGFAKVQYDAGTNAITAGLPACVTALGKVRGCYNNGTSTYEATMNLGIIPLESKASGSGSDLKVMINLQ